MRSTSTEVTKPKAISANGLGVATAVAAAGAAGINLLVYFVVPAFFDLMLEVPLRGPGSALQPLPARMVVMGSITPAIGGGLLLGALNHLSARPIMIFRIVALAVLLLSLALLLALPTTEVALTLAAMHVLAAATITYVLTACS